MRPDVSKERIGRIDGPDRLLLQFYLLDCAETLRVCARKIDKVANTNVFAVSQKMLTGLKFADRQVKFLFTEGVAGPK